MRLTVSIWIFDTSFYSPSDHSKDWIWCNTRHNYVLLSFLDFILFYPLKDGDGQTLVEKETLLSRERSSKEMGAEQSGWYHKHVMICSKLINFKRIRASGMTSYTTPSAVLLAECHLLIHKWWNDKTKISRAYVTYKAMWQIPRWVTKLNNQTYVDVGGKAAVGWLSTWLNIGTRLLYIPRYRLYHILRYRVHCQLWPAALRSLHRLVSSSSSISRHFNNVTCAYNQICCTTSTSTASQAAWCPQ